MTDLSTGYLGLPLAHPIVAAASPLTGALDSARRLEDAGAAAIVTESLWEEEISVDRDELVDRTEAGTGAFAEATTYLPDHGRYLLGGEEHLERLQRMKEALSIPVIGSLNGATPGGWVEYARLIEEAGADALELNVYFLATDPAADAAAVEARTVDLVRSVRARVRIPLAVKIGPYFSSLPHLARRLVEAGADGLVLFNRFYQPDVDLETMKVVPNLLLSTPASLRLPLRWTAILRPILSCSLAATGGVRTGEDAVKAVLVGADVVQIASALLARGETHLGAIVAEARAWFEEREVSSVAQVRGSLSYRNVEDPSAYERSTYMAALKTYLP